MRIDVDAINWENSTLSENYAHFLIKTIGVHKDSSIAKKIAVVSIYALSMIPLGLVVSCEMAFKGSVILFGAPFSEKFTIGKAGIVFLGSVIMGFLAISTLAVPLAAQDMTIRINRTKCDQPSQLREVLVNAVKEERDAESAWKELEELTINSRARLKVALQESARVNSITSRSYPKEVKKKVKNAYQELKKELEELEAKERTAFARWNAASQASNAARAAWKESLPISVRRI